MPANFSGRCLSPHEPRSQKPRPKHSSDSPDDCITAWWELWWKPDGSYALLSPRALARPSSFRPLRCVVSYRGPRLSHANALLPGHSPRAWSPTIVWTIPPMCRWKCTTLIDCFSCQGQDSTPMGHAAKKMCCGCYRGAPLCSSCFPLGARLR